jgi:hypothetical protein
MGQCVQSFSPALLPTREGEDPKNLNNLSVIIQKITLFELVFQVVHYKSVYSFPNVGNKPHSFPYATLIPIVQVISPNFIVKNNDS